jgi:hypothetical protein
LTGEALLDRFTQQHPFHDTELSALGSVDEKTLRLGRAPWAPSEMFASKRDGEALEQPLDPTRPAWRGNDVIHQDEATAWSQHAFHLADGTPLVGNPAQ